MHRLLENPVYHALLTGDQPLNIGNAQVKFFDEQVSPFVGFERKYEKGFSDLSQLLPAGRKILYATPAEFIQPPGWQVTHAINGLQFVYKGGSIYQTEFPGIIPLTEAHVDEMILLARLTKPGPFDKRTIEFGSYFGSFDKGKLVAMTGQRLHVKNFTEISAVCTHPEHTGKGYANSLLQHQLGIILRQGQQPFLHVRDDNERAIALYQRLGFVVSRSMCFYFMKKP